MMKGVADGHAVPAACILIAITTPVTFWSYSKMVQGWQASKDPDLVTASQGSPSAITSASYCLTFIALIRPCPPIVQLLVTSIL